MMLVLAVRTDAGAGLPAGAAVLHPRRDRGGVRGRPRRREPDAAPHGDEAATARDLLAQFRALAPERRPIAFQRWNSERVVLSLALRRRSRSARSRRSDKPVGARVRRTRSPGLPDCGTSNVMILMAQSVPSATSVPCVARSRPVGSWAAIRSPGPRQVLARLRPSAGTTRSTVTLQPPRRRARCANATRVPSDEAGMRRFERPEQLPPDLRPHAVYLFDRWLRDLPLRVRQRGDAPLLVFEADAALAFQARSDARRGGARPQRAASVWRRRPPCPGGS